MRRSVCAVLLAIASAGAGAQEAYPSRAISIIVPNPPGGMNQITAQPLSAVIEKMTKQPAPVLNKPGGTAAVGTAFVATQKPDGYNILVTTPNIYLVVEKNKAQNIESPYRLEQIQPMPQLWFAGDTNWRTRMARSAPIASRAAINGCSPAATARLVQLTPPSGR